MSSNWIYQSRWLFVPCDLEIWLVTITNNRAHLLYYVKLCASFQSHRWLQTSIIVWKGSIPVKIDHFFIPCDLEIWRMTLKNNKAPLLCCYKLCAPFHSEQWFQTEVTVRKPPYWVKIEDLFVPRDLEIWLMTLKDNRAPLISNFIVLQALCIIS